MAKHKKMHDSELFVKSVLIDDLYYSIWRRGKKMDAPMAVYFGPDQTMIGIKASKRAAQAFIIEHAKNERIK